MMAVVSGVGSCLGGMSETVLCVLWIEQVGRYMRSIGNWGFHCGEGDTIEGNEQESCRAGYEFKMSH